MPSDVSRSVGFTGTRRGMTAPQRATVRYWLVELDLDIFNFGWCYGADDEAAEEAREIGYRLRAHPGPDPLRRGPVVPDSQLDPLPFLERDTQIVLDSRVVIAAPAQMVEQRRGGTWPTIRRARRYGRDLIYAWPNGTCHYKENDVLTFYDS